MQPYARAYAMRLTAVAQGDAGVAEMVQGQLDQYRYTSNILQSFDVDVYIQVLVCCQAGGIPNRRWVYPTIEVIREQYK